MDGSTFAGLVFRGKKPFVSRNSLKYHQLRKPFKIRVFEAAGAFRCKYANLRA